MPIVREIDDANQYFKIEADKEKIVLGTAATDVWGYLARDARHLDDSALRQLTLDYAQTRDSINFGIYRLNFQIDMFPHALFGRGDFFFDNRNAPLL